MNKGLTRIRIAWALFFIGLIPASIVLIVGLLSLLAAIVGLVLAIILACIFILPSFLVAPGHTLEYRGHEMKVEKGVWYHYINGEEDDT